uniref:Uncharacterized protein n=1 Tax=viral metagenome TaxID=1070528 RepID=A0A6M3IKV5_9ZZZZ
MEIYQAGETVTVYSRVKDTMTGDWVAPSTIKITIYNAAGEVVINDDDMLEVPDTVGSYFYYFDTTDRAGVFKYKITAVRAGRKTINKDDYNTFKVV